MEQLNFANLTIDRNYNILDYNSHFEQIFINTVYKKPIINLSDILNYNTNDLGLKKSGLIIKNNLINKKSMLSYYYFNCVKNNNTTYNIQLINWLNWINNLYESMNIGYVQMVDLSDKNKINVKKSSDIHSFNAFFPLLMHNPLDCIHKIKTNAFHGILRKFINRKDTENINKDYAHYTYSRLETSIREQTGYFLMEVKELMQKRDILNFRVEGEIYIPNTILTQDLTITDFYDQFLSTYLSNMANSSNSL